MLSRKYPGTSGNARKPTPSQVPQTIGPSLYPGRWVLDERVPLPERVDRKETVVAPTRRTYELPLHCFRREKLGSFCQNFRKTKKDNYKFHLYYLTTFARVLQKRFGAS